jgi:hypothetical protein
VSGHLKTETPDGRAFLRREFWNSFQFLAIAFIAATVGAFSWALPPGDDINFLGMMHRMIRDFYRPWFLAFLGLSVLRLFVLWLVQRKRWR